MAKSTDDSSTPAAEEAVTDAEDTTPASDAKGGATGTTAKAGASAKGGTAAKGAKAAKSGTGGTREKGTRTQRLRSGNPRRRASAKTAGADTAAAQRVKAQRVGNPGWFVPVMLGLMIIGLLWVVTFYITGEQYPVEAWGFWNLGAGFAFILAGFAMTTRWR